MEDKKIQNSEVIDLREVFKTLWKRKKTFFKVWIITFILACAWILPVPRTYTTEIKLAPELENAPTGGGLASIASTFGLDIGNMQSSDAIYPLLYPELFKTNDFIASLMDIHVENEDGTIKTDYYDYLLNHKKIVFYKWPIILVRRQIKNMLPKEPQVPGSGTGNNINPYRLSEEQNAVIEGVMNNIACDVDIKTELITITVKDQDRLICATIADSVRSRLQAFITEYRTNKARTDMEYYADLTEKAKIAYEKATDAYGVYCDAHRNSILQTALSRRDELENDMQMKFNTYNAMNTQLEAAKAKVQERTPAFTILQGAGVPIKATGPKRVLFVIGMLFLATLGTIFHIFKESIKNQLL